MKLDKYGKCPECDAQWDGGDIFDTFRGQEWTQEMSDEQLNIRIANDYSPPYKWSRIIGIEDPSRYDGVSIWMCPDCKAKWDRFSGERIEE